MSLGWMEMAFLGLLALLIFGKDLPRVARDVGKVLGEIRRHLQGISRL